MSKFKAASGLFVMVVIPLGIALVWAGLGLGYAEQHVHDVSASIEAGRIVKHVDDFDHSTGGVISVAGVLAFTWAALTAAFILWGGSMFANRNKRWDF